jgi:hypothetical protein
VLRLASGIAAVVAAVIGLPMVVAFAALALSEAVGRWLFYVAVVPLNMPGAFWRGAAGSHR